MDIINIKLIYYNDDNAKEYCETYCVKLKIENIYSVRSLKKTHVENRHLEVVLMTSLHTPRI